MNRKDGSGNKLGILFLHHTVDAVVKNNLRSIRKHNPEAVIITMSAGKPLRNGYSLNNTPAINELHLSNTKRSSDWLVCSWFLQRKEKCDKWWIVEWDTHCTISVRRYYERVWNFPFVASSVRLPHREPEWPWFRGLQTLPEIYRPYIIGAVPFLYLISEIALKRTCRTLLKTPISVGNGEFRFSTAAHKSGFAPCGYSPPFDRITWIPWDYPSERPTISHPVKQILHKTTRSSKKLLDTAQKEICLIEKNMKAYGVIQVPPVDS